ncbi:MAG TPA: NUDIX hydrolase [Candidatus Paceibacterota bacterium]
MPAKKISLENAKKDKLFYFVANVIVFRETDGRCLLLKRDLREKVHPSKWGVIGGKLGWSDLPLDAPSRRNGDVLDFENTVEDLLVREAKEEAGIEIEPKLTYINSVAFVRPDGIPVAMVKFDAPYKGGEVLLERGAFTDFKWVDAEEAKRLDCIEEFLWK